MIGELEDAKTERDSAVAALATERAEREPERAEKERLAARLRVLGVDPDEV
jgi:hypothetical protein